MRPTLILMVLVIIGCKSDPDHAPRSDGGTNADGAAPPSQNPIDVAVWPRFVAGGHTSLNAAGSDELCRRMSLDLCGRVPSASEAQALCAGRSPAQTAEAMMATPLWPPGSTVFPEKGPLWDLWA